MTPPTPSDPDRVARAFADYARTRDEALRAELVQLHLGLAEHLARRFANRGIPLDDLVQVAALGLVHAIDRFDPGRGVSFSAFAAPTILGEIKHHFRDRSWDLHVPRRVQELTLRINVVLDDLSQQLRRSPTIRELAAATQSSEEEVLEAIEAGQAFQALTLDGAPGDPGIEVRRAVARPDIDLRGADDRVLVELALDALPPRERLILRLTYFEGMSQRDIGARLGISQMHVSRLLRRSLDTLREDPQLRAEERAGDDAP